MTALTVRGVKSMLGRAKIDYSALTFRYDPAVWTDMETGERSTSVVIEGPIEVRRAAMHELYDRGLSCAPYPDHDEWHRRGTR